MNWIILIIANVLIGGLYYWAFDEGHPKITIISIFVLNWIINAFVYSKLF